MRVSYCLTQFLCLPGWDFTGSLQSNFILKNGLTASPPLNIEPCKQCKVTFVLFSAYSIFRFLSHLYFLPLLLLLFSWIVVSVVFSTDYCTNGTPSGNAIWSYCNRNANILYICTTVGNSLVNYISSCRNKVRSLLPECFFLCNTKKNPQRRCFLF